MKRRVIGIFLVTLWFGLMSTDASEKDEIGKKMDKIILKNVEIESMPLPKVLEKIQELSKNFDPQKKGVPISFDLVDRDKKQVMAISIPEVPLGKIIEYICRLGNLEYSITDDGIVIKSSNVYRMTTSSEYLFKAVKDNNLAYIKELLSNGVDVNARDKDEWARTPLYHARKIETAKLLIEKGADANFKDKKGITPLHIASDLEIAKLLIEKGADVNAKDEDDKTPLHPRYVQSIEKIKLLIEKGANVNAKDKGGWTPLVYTPNRAIAELLIEKGADINAKDKNDRTPLHIMASNLQSAEILKLLIEKGADINAKDKNDCTPLHIMVSNIQNMGTVELLIEKGADINAKDKKGWTSLNHVIMPHTANGKSNMKAIKLLLDKGVNINDKDILGRTPLFWAILMADNTDIELLEFLLSKGADINIKDQNGSTPLAVANVLDYKNKKLKAQVIKLLKTPRKKPKI